MSESKVETSEVKPVETKPDVEKPAVVELTPLEQTANTQGWVPKEQWVEQGGNPDEWRTAKEFVDRGELYKSLHSTKRDLKQTQAALTALQRHHQYVYEKAHQQALQDLKADKRAAIRNQDLEQAEIIDEEIDNLKEAHQKEKQELLAQQTVPTTPHPEFQAWVGKNSWYNTDEEMREFADATGFIYLNKNPGSSPEVVLQHIETKIKKQYPEKFGQKRAAPNAVQAVDRSGKASKKVESDIQLDEMEQSIMKTFVQSGVMTEAEYKAELKKSKGL